MQRGEGEPIGESVLFQVGKGDDGEGGEKRRARVDGPVEDGVPDLVSSELIAASGTLEELLPSVRQAAAQLPCPGSGNPRWC